MSRWETVRDRLSLGAVVKPTYADILYIEPSEKHPASAHHKLDIYLPVTGGGPFPVLVFIHGGAFYSGDKTLRSGSVPYQATKFGFAVVSIEYRLCDVAIFPAAVFDCKAAVRFLRAKGFVFKLKTDRIGVCGESAGGHLAAMLGTSAAVKDLEDLSLGYAGHSCHVDAVVDWYGPTDFLRMDEQMQELGLPQITEPHLDPQSPESRYLGVKDMREHVEIVTKSNPIAHVTTDCPPFLIQHGIKDPYVPALQSVELYHKIVAVCGEGRAMLRLFQDAGHGDVFEAFKPFRSGANIELYTNFLKKHLVL